jgi:flagellar basal-body rod protein FlgF
MHVAVRGDAFLVVKTPAGDRYTRNGAFEVDAKGTLVNSDGYTVQGDGGPITFSQPETGISIAPDGTVSTSTGIRGRIKLVNFKNARSLKNEGGNVFSSTDQPQAAGIDGRLEPGALERSNVKPVLEMTRLMDVNRTYSTVSSIISRLDDLRGTAIRRLADVA